MAKKKSASKASPNKSLKAKTTAKKKPVAKKIMTKRSAKPTADKKKSKAAKPSKKKKTFSKASSAIKKVVTKKSVSKKKQTTPKKKVVNAVAKPKAKKLVKKKLLTQKTKTSSANKKIKTNQAKKPITKRATAAVLTAPGVPKTKEPLLSSTERYNIGGLFSCAMERRHDPDCSRLRAVLRHLDLTSHEKDNLIRLSEGFMIPKLFAENLPEQKVNQLLADLVKFGIKQGNYEKYWREEIQQIGFWLGVFPAQFQAIEHQVKR
jgi:hypothetical protein